MHNVCAFYTFSTFAQKIFRERDCSFTWSFGKVMCSKSTKMVCVISIIRHRLWIIYEFFDFFCSNIIFDQKLSSCCWDKFDYPGSIVYLSCSNFCTRWVPNIIRNWTHCTYSNYKCKTSYLLKNLHFKTFWSNRII